MVSSIEIQEAFRNYHNVSDELASSLAAVAEKIDYKKNAAIFKAGEKAHAVALITKGLVHSYILNDQKEMTIWFGEKGDFITSFHSFFTGEDGFETIDCIEDTSVILIPIHEIKKLISENKEMLQLYSIILEKCYMYWEQRYLVNQIYDSEKRYAHFYNRSKEMVIGLPLRILSSYLNIRIETLSRIRKRWLSSN
jgi:CRP-like cAMP-binding protein